MYVANDMDRGKIHNRQAAQQLKDFSGLRFGKITPTDIDGFLDFQNKVFVIIEVKYGETPLPMGQRIAYEHIADACTTGGKPTLVIVAHHRTNAPEDISVASLPVTLIRLDGRWRPPSTPHTVFSAIDSFLKQHHLKQDEKRIGHYKITQKGKGRNMTCKHCEGQGFIQCDVKYGHVRCIKCGREHTVLGEIVLPVKGSKRLVAEREKVYLDAKRKEVLRPDLEMFTCNICGKEYKPHVWNQSRCPECIKAKKTLNCHSMEENKTIRHFDSTRLWELMKEKRLKCNTLDVLANVGGGSVSLYRNEAKIPFRKNAQKICDALNVPLEELYHETTTLTYKGMRAQQTIKRQQAGGYL